MGDETNAVGEAEVASKGPLLHVRSTNTHALCVQQSLKECNTKGRAADGQVKADASDGLIQ